jgi:hypothetical protein
MALNLKGVKTPEEAEVLVQGVTAQVQARINVKSIKLEAFTENYLWYRVFTQNGKEAILEVRITDLDTHVLMEGYTGWRHIGKLQ